MNHESDEQRGRQRRLLLPPVETTPEALARSFFLLAEGHRWVTAGEDSMRNPNWRPSIGREQRALRNDQSKEGYQLWRLVSSA